MNQILFMKYSGRNINFNAPSNFTIGRLLHQVKKILNTIGR